MNNNNNRYKQLLDDKIHDIHLSQTDIYQFYQDPEILSNVSCPSIFVEQMKYKDNLIHQDNPIIDSLHLSKIKYKMDYPLTQFKVEFQHLLKYIFYHDKENKPTKLQTFWDTSEFFFEKSIIRIELYEQGWDPVKIEECIQRYFIQSEVDEEHLYVRYLLLGKYLNIESEYPKKIGRPSMTTNVKSIIQQRINYKLSNKVKIEHNIVQQIRQIFQKQDIEYLMEQNKENEQMKLKLIQLQKIIENYNLDE